MRGKEGISVRSQRVGLTLPSIARQTHVDIEPIKAIVLDELDSRARKRLPVSGRPAEADKVGREGPATNREEDSQVPVLLFEQVELLEAAVEVGAGVVPGEEEAEVSVCARPYLTTSSTTPTDQLSPSQWISWSAQESVRKTVPSSGLTLANE